MCATISGNVELQHYDLKAKSLPSKTDTVSYFLPGEVCM